MTTPADKIMSYDQALNWCRNLRAQGRKIVVTNGVFDLLHRGHAQYLHDAAACGDALLVCVNSDSAVRQLKGPSRPIIKENDRAFMLASLECVSAVVLFDTVKPLEIFRTFPFDIYAKGGDYTIDTLDREEYAILKTRDLTFAFIPFVTGFSTTSTIRLIKNGEAVQSASTAAQKLDSRLNFAFTRRSVRAFQPRPVGDDLIALLLDAAMAAPSAGAKDPWQFVVLKDPAVRKQVADCLPNGHFLADAPAGIIVCGDLDRAHGHELSYLLQDTAAATQNLLLAANALSLGACWLGIHPREDRIRAISSILRLPPNVIPVAGTAIGFPAQELPARTRADNSRIHWNTF